MNCDEPHVIHCRIRTKIDRGLIRKFLIQVKRSLWKQVGISPPWTTVSYWAITAVDNVFWTRTFVLRSQWYSGDSAEPSELRRAEGPPPPSGLPASGYVRPPLSGQSQMTTGQQAAVMSGRNHTASKISKQAGVES